MPPRGVRPSGQSGATGVADSGAPGANTLNRLWSIQSAWDLADKVIDRAVAQLPSFTHSITVAVQGGPEAEIRRVYYLALSAAFGRYRNKVRGKTQSGQIQTTWDVTGKAANVEIVYTTGRTEEAFNDNPAVGAGVAAGIATTLATGNVVAGILVGGAVYAGGTAVVRTGRKAMDGPADPTASATDLFRRGPEQLTIGGNFGDLLDSNRYFRLSTPSPNPTWQVYKQCQFSMKRNNVPLTTYRRQGPLREFPVMTFSAKSANATQYPFSVTQVRSFIGVLYAGTGSIPEVDCSRGGGTFHLPDHGRIITTADKTANIIQPPSPPVDGQTRGGMLALVSQTLQRPCFLPDSPPCTSTALSHAGVWVTARGNSDKFEDVAQKVMAARGSTRPVVTAPGKTSEGLSVDGYNLPVPEPINFEAH